MNSNWKSLPSSSNHENELVEREIVSSKDPAPSDVSEETPDLSTPTTFTLNPLEFTADIVISTLGETDPLDEYRVHQHFYATQ